MKDIKAKSSDSKFFTIEFFGVTLIVFSFLMFILLLFGENVLFEIGKEVQFFLLGLAGYMSYPLLLCLAYIGFMLLLGKKIIKSNFKGKVNVCLVFILIAICFLNILTGSKSVTSYSSYLKSAFNSGRNGLEGVFAGGYIFSIITYPFLRYFKFVGAIICFSLFLGLWVFYVYKNKNKLKIQISGRQEYKGTLPQDNIENANVQTNKEPLSQNNLENANSSNFGVGYNSNQNSNFNGGNRYNNYQNNSSYSDITGGYSNPYERYNNETSQRNNNNYYNQQVPQNQDVNYTNGFNSGTYSENFLRIFGEPKRQVQENYSTNNYGMGSVSNPISKNEDLPICDYNENNRIVEYNNDTEIKSQETFIDDYSSNEEIESLSTKNIKNYFEENNNFSSEDFDIKDDSFEEEIEKIEEEPQIESVEVEQKVEEIKESVDNRKIIENAPINYQYNAPPISFLHSTEPKIDALRFNSFVEEKKRIILETLEAFGIKTTIENYYRGPAVTRFDINVPPRVTMGDIIKHYNDINLRLGTSTDARLIERVPGTSCIGLEVPNIVPDEVGLKEIICSKEFNQEKFCSLVFALGKNIIGAPVCLDIAEMPHLLIAGTTGSGKSVCLNSMLVSLVYKYTPNDVRLLIIDPKMVEFSNFKNLPHMLFDKIIDTIPYCNSALTWAVNEMNRRYDIMNKAGVKKISDYNSKMQSLGQKTLFRLVIIIDEFGDFIIQDRKGIGEKICLLAQKARAAGIHLVLATQRPSADIIGGPIKTNFPARIVFRVASMVDSKVAFDQTGAQKLMGRGDCLYKTSVDVERAMGAYVSDKECETICEYVSMNNESYYDYNAWSDICSRVSDSSRELGEIKEGTKSGGQAEFVELGDKAPDIYTTNAIRIGFEYGGISASLLVRKLSIGTNRAARIVDWLIERGYVNPEVKSNKRSFTFTSEELESKITEINNLINQNDNE